MPKLESPMHVNGEMVYRVPEQIKRDCTGCFFLEYPASCDPCQDCGSGTGVIWLAGLRGALGSLHLKEKP